jgi:hypothetical protein
LCAFFEVQGLRAKNSFGCKGEHLYKILLAGNRKELAFFLEFP